MSDARPEFGDFWDTVIDDPLLAKLPDTATFSHITVACARGEAPTTPPTRVPTPLERAAVDALPTFESGEAGDLALGDQILGEGGMGVVVLARQRSLDRDVAVKTVHPGSTDPVLVDALVQEARLAGGLDHPNVVPIHALGRNEADRPLLVMKKVEGHTWSSLLAEPRHPAWSASGRWSDDPLLRNLEILLEVCDAVHFAHDRGVLHRDLKPENVMVGAYGEVYLMDWGLAASAADASYSPGGSPPYMAPEMLGGEATEQTDVYQLGAILHQILTGRRRHRGPTRLGVLMSVHRSEPVAFDPEVPAELAQASNRATHAEPAERFPTVLAFRRAITDYLAHRGSLQLAAAARQLLVELRGLLDAPDTDSHVLERRFAECRFGFQQSLLAWPENPAAQAGLRECLDALIAWELERRSAGAAATLLAERIALDPGPRQQLAEWEAQVKLLRQDSERVRRLASDLDASVSSRERARFFLGAVTLIVPSVTGMYFAIQRGLITADLALLIALPILGLTLVSSVMYLGRKTLLANVFNRRIMYTLLLLILGILLHRIVGRNVGMTFEQVLTTDLVLVSAVACGAGIGISPYMFLLAAITALGAIAASLHPDHALAILVTSMVTAAVVGGALIVWLNKRNVSET